MVRFAKTSEMENCPYISLGQGNRDLIIIPGLTPVRVIDNSASYAGVFRRFSGEFKIWIIDRPDIIPENVSNEDLSDAVAGTISSLGLGKSDVIGLSQGGMIAQFLAIDHPEMVRTLTLGSTASRSNDTAIKTISHWIDLALKEDWVSFNHDSFSKIFTESYITRHRKAFDILASTTKTDNPQRFVRLARAIFQEGPHERLDEIKCPTLVMGAEDDLVLTSKASYDIAEKLNCQIYMFKGYKHSVYDECPEFYDRAYEFITKH